MDGMDISLLSIDQKNRTIEWAGANLPLHLCSDNTIQSFAPQKQPIGRTIHPEPFYSTSIAYKGGEMIYLSSDGYADQFGEKTGKKFMKKNFHELLRSICMKDITSQKQVIISTFEQWRGEQEQIDDVCVLGFRL